MMRRSDVHLTLTRAILRESGMFPIVWSGSMKTILVWGLILALFGLTWYWVSPKDERRVPFSEFMMLLKAPKTERHVTEVRIRGQEYKFSVAASSPTQAKSMEHLIAVGPDAEHTPIELLNGAVTVTYDSSSWSNWHLSWLVAFLLVLSGTLAYKYRQSLNTWRSDDWRRGASRARVVSDSHRKTTFADVGGMQEPKAAIDDIIAFLKDPKRFTRLGAQIPKAVLFGGPPGTGKTLMARALAGEAGVPFYFQSALDFIDSRGNTPACVRDLFSVAKNNAPCIVFLDHLDALGTIASFQSHESEERNQAIQQLLHEMDGFESNDGVIVVFAANRIDVVDPALLRPGRIDKIIECRLPRKMERRGILGVLTRKVPLAQDVDLEILAQLTHRLSGADLAAVVNRAALESARDDLDAITMSKLENAVRAVAINLHRSKNTFTERPESEQYLARSALYTAGQMIVARQLGLLPDDGFASASLNASIVELIGPPSPAMTHRETEDYIAAALAGRAAELSIEENVGESTTLGQHDLAYATQLATRFVREFGFAKSIPLRALAADSATLSSEEPFISPELLRRADREISDLIAQSLNRAVRILKGDPKGLMILTNTFNNQALIAFSQISPLLVGGVSSKEAKAVASPNV